MRNLTMTITVNIQRTGLLILFSCLLLASGCMRSDEEFADRPDMQRVPVQGGELEYEVRGEGEPVLLIHGALIAGAFLPLTTEPALADYRLIRYHRRGYAGSTAPDGPLKREVADARALLRHLGVGRAHIVGHSGGGRIALQLALDAPEVVHSLVLLEPGPVGPVPSSEALGDEVFEPAHERYQAGDTAGAVDVFMSGVTGIPEWRREIERTVPGGPEQAEQDAATVFEDPENPTPDERWRFDKEKAEKLPPRIPILYVSGSESRSYFKEIRNLFRTWFPEADDHVVQGVGHALQMEGPQAAHDVAAATADFLRRHPLDKHSNQ